MKKITSKTEEGNFFVKLLAGVTIPLVLTFSSVAYAQGTNSPAECMSPTATIDGNDDLLSYTAVDGHIITGVCIKSGSNMFEGWHSGLLGNGTYENSCYSVSGVGSQTVVIQRIGAPSSTCQTLSHVDVFNSPAPTQTPTPEPSLSPTPTPDPTSSPSASPSTPIPSPSATPASAPVPSSAPTSSPASTSTPVPSSSTTGAVLAAYAEATPTPAALEGAVLGASAELPATGTESLWIFTALTSLFSGTGLLALGFKKGQKKI